MVLSLYLSSLLECHKRLCAIDDTSIDAVVEVKRRGGLNVGLAVVERSRQNQIKTFARTEMQHIGV